MLNPMNWSRRQWLALIIAFVVAWAGQKLYLNYRLQSHQVQAQLIEQKSDSLTVSGSYILDDSKTSDLAHPALMTVKINANTKFTKTTWLAPTQEDLSTSKSLFYVRQSDKSQQGSLSDLKNMRGILLLIKTNNNFLNKNEIIASEVSYSLPTSQTGFGFSGQITKGNSNTISASGLFSIQNSPGMFIGQKSSTVKLVISPDAQLLRTIIPSPGLNPNSKTVAAPSKPTKVTPSQLLADVAIYKNITVNALSPTNVYWQPSFTPQVIYYSIFPGTVK